jgi:hypothetical protein
MLRKAILAYGVLAVVGAIALALAGVQGGLVFYALIQGLILIAALLLERGRYRPPTTESGAWQETQERFVDPSTGQLMKVRYNPQTGARDYVPTTPLPDPPPQGGRELPSDPRPEPGRELPSDPFPKG